LADNLSLWTYSERSLSTWFDSWIQGLSCFEGNIIISNDVWIGYGGTIMMCVTFGNGSVVAARSVVVNDVPFYVIVTANLPRGVRDRFDPAMIATLPDTAWWEPGDPNTDSVVPVLQSVVPMQDVLAMRDLSEDLKAGDKPA
jgi:hypothetical protein